MPYNSAINRQMRRFLIVDIITLSLHAAWTTTCASITPGTAPLLSMGNIHVLVSFVYRRIARSSVGRRSQDFRRFYAAVAVGLHHRDSYRQLRAACHGHASIAAWHRLRRLDGHWCGRGFHLWHRDDGRGADGG